MGAMKENPRYHVLSVRVDDRMISDVDESVKAGKTNRTNWLLEAVQEKLDRDSR